MTVEEFEKMAVGLDTGYRDMNGKPIRVGDKIVYYKKCTEYVGEDEISNYPAWAIVGNGHRGYVYTGKIMRYNHTVGFTFESGYEIVPNAYKYLREKDEAGNLKTILVLGDGQAAPKLTLMEILRNKGEAE